MKCARALHPLLLVLVVFLLVPQPARADKPITVGDGTAASCTETAVGFALAVAEASGGGTIRFKCGKMPTTIVFNEIEGGALVVLPGDTVIDGGGLISFAGNPNGYIFVPIDTNAVLKNLTILSKSLFPSIRNDGTLSVERSTVSDNGGGGISNGGTLIVDKSTFSGNGGFVNSAISNGGQLIVKNSLFFNNDGGLNGAGGIENHGSATIKNSTFLQNSGEGTGGIRNGGTMTVTNSEFSDNHGIFQDGGITNVGTLTVKNTTFSDNLAHMGGTGGIGNYGTLTVENSTFSENTGNSGGGIANVGTLSVSNSEFFGNEGYLGGGLLIYSGMATIYNSEITNNTARQAGGGIYIYGGTLTLEHTTVTGNTPDDIAP